MLKFQFLKIFVGLLLLNFVSCQTQNEKLDFKQFNDIVSQSINHSLNNQCYKFSYFESNMKMKVLGIVVNPIDSVRIDTAINFVNFDIIEFFKSSQSTSFKNDTLYIKLDNIYRVYPAFYDEIDDFIMYHSKFNEFELGTTKFSFVKTLLVKNPRVKYLAKTNQVLIEIDRYFEYVIDKTFLLVTTDKSFKVLNIECIEKVKPIVPYHNRDTITKYINLDTIQHD